MSGTVQHQIQWLIRKNVKLPEAQASKGSGTGIVVLGPYLADQVRYMVQEGMLEADDELCPENGYWFGLGETVEVKRFLSIEHVNLALETIADLETTQPDLEVAEEKTPPGIDPLELAARAEATDATAIFTVKPPSSRRRLEQKTGVNQAATGGSAQAAEPSSSQQLRRDRAPHAPASAEEIAARFGRVAQVRDQGHSHFGAVSHEDENKSVFGLETGKIWLVLILLGVVLAIAGVVWVVASVQGIAS